MDHCDILKDQITVQLDRLTARFDCLTNVTVVLASAEKNETTKEQELHLGTPGRNKTMTFSNPFLSTLKCKPIIVSLRTNVSFPGEEELRKSKRASFRMDPTKCPEWRNANCSDKVAVRAAETSREQADLPKPNMMILPLVFFSGVGVFLFIAFAVFVIWRRVTKKGRKDDENFQTEENEMYATYSRGWDENGEYGDGDVVEIVDRNGYYMTE